MILSFRRIHSVPWCWSEKLNKHWIDDFKNWRQSVYNRWPTPNFKLNINKSWFSLWIRLEYKCVKSLFSRILGTLDIADWSSWYARHFGSYKTGKLSETWHKDRNSAVKFLSNLVGQDSTTSVYSTISS